jgi:hypothetical protein
MYLLNLFSDEGELITDIENIQHFVYTEALTIKKIKDVYNLVKENPSLNQKEFISQDKKIISNYKTLASKKQATSIIFNWVNYCLSFESGNTVSMRARRRNNDLYYYAFGPNNAVSTLIDFSQGNLTLEPNNKRKLRDLEHLGLLDFKHGNYLINSSGLQIIKSDKPEELLANFAEKDKNIQLFLKHCLTPTDSPKTEKIIESEKEFFAHLNSHGSKRAKCSVFYSWAKFIRKVKNGSL